MNNQIPKLKDHRRTVRAWLSLPAVWSIPVYQRHYSWHASAKNADGPVDMFWNTLKEQTEKRLNGETPSGHYLGSVIVKNQTDPGADDGILQYDVVDGQQRLTTIQIALLVLAKLAKEHRCDKEVEDELKKYIFVNSNESMPRLRPSNFDNRQFQSILYNACGIVLDFGGRGSSRENVEKSKIVDTFAFFEDEFGDLITRKQSNERPEVGAEKAIRAVASAILDGVDIVRIVLRDEDNAQRVFESLNNYAKPLTTFDLIRNNVFNRAATDKGVPPGLDKELFYGKDWQQLEEPYWEKAADGNKVNPTPHIDAYIARMLLAKKRSSFLFNRNSIFETYKKCYQNTPIRDVIPDMIRYTGIYQYLDTGEGDNPLGLDSDFGVFHHRNWPNRDFYPVIFAIVGGGADADEKRKMIGLLESYAVRRAVCGLATEAYNKRVASLCKALGESPDYAKLVAELKKSTAESELLPDDARVLRECVGTNFYKCPFRQFAFAKIEMHMHGPHPETTVKKDLTTDHILPKGWDKDGEWRKMLGGTDEWLVNNYLNTIGNLTLMHRAKNSSKGNRSFAKVKGLLLDSGLKLNNELAKEGEWNVEKITERSKMLGEKICKIWPYPDAD